MDQYMEHMVKKQTTMADKGIRIGCILLLCLMGAGGLWIPLLCFAAVVFFVIYLYLIYPATDLEYEYLYVDRSLTVDKIMAKEKRTRVIWTIVGIVVLVAVILVVILSILNKVL